MKNWLILFTFLFFIFPFISANTINHEIFIKNYISNINEFPNYEFILSVQYPPWGGDSGSTRLEIVNENGLIPVWGGRNPT